MATTSTRGVYHTLHLDETLRKGVYETQIPDIAFLYEASITRNPNWNVGDRVCLPDGRVFRYAKCGLSLTDMEHGAKNYNILVTAKDTITAAASVGDTYIDLTFDDSDGMEGDGVIAVDELRGGYISLYNSSTVREQRGIMGNTVRANGDTDDTRIYLDAPLGTAVSADSNVEVLSNPYGDLQQATDAVYTSVMGMPCVLATTGQYFWIQTWGIIRITGTTTAEIMAGWQYDRQYVFNSGGSVVPAEEGCVDAGYSLQHAGFLVERSNGGTGYVAPFINLQINP